MRFAQFSIVDGQKTGVIRYDAWIDVPNEVNFYGDTMSDCDDYEMMVSPLGKNNFVIDGNLISPFEWNAEGDGAEPQVLGRNTKIAAKVNGANYFKFAGKSLMVAPKLNEDSTKIAGIQLFDISAGLDNAVEVAIDGAIEPTEYKYASAHGEAELELSSDDLTIGAEMVLYLVVDGKAYKFTEVVETVAPVAGTANPYAYALTSEFDKDVLTVNYKLNSAATAVNIFVKDAVGNVVVNGVVEHHGLLLDIADLGAVEFHIDIPDIDIVHQDLSVIMVIVAHQQIDQCGLAGTGSAYNTHDISRFDGQIHIGKGLFGAVKGEIDVPELDLAMELVRMLSLAEVCLRLSINDIQDPLRRVQRILVRVVEIGKEVHRSIEHGGIRDKRYQKTCRDKVRIICRPRSRSAAIRRSPQILRYWETEW